MLRTQVRRSPPRQQDDVRLWVHDYQNLASLPFLCVEYIDVVSLPKNGAKSGFEICVF